jgi:hypothetical protein
MVRVQVKVVRGLVKQDDFWPAQEQRGQCDQDRFPA